MCSIASGISSKRACAQDEQRMAWLEKPAGQTGWFQLSVKSCYCWGRLGGKGKGLVKTACTSSWQWRPSKAARRHRPRIILPDNGLNAFTHVRACRAKQMHATILHICDTYQPRHDAPYCRQQAINHVWIQPERAQHHTQQDDCCRLRKAGQERELEAAPSAPCCIV